jgi:two-component system alkaline phosphatase synthesis response regulator PhoP
MSDKIKIAVIEDEPSICEMYRIKLLSAGYEVKTAHDGQEGLELLEEFKPKLILLDLKMPVMTGDEMLAKLRETEWGAEIRVIILTNISRDEAPKNIQFLHVDRYIVKAHYTPSQVVEIVSNTI